MPDRFVLDVCFSMAALIAAFVATFAASSTLLLPIPSTSFVIASTNRRECLPLICTDDGPGFPQNSRSGKSQGDFILSGKVREKSGNLI